VGFLFQDGGELFSAWGQIVGEHTNLLIAAGLILSPA
jgi:hypothetical protein